MHEGEEGWWEEGLAEAVAPQQEGDVATERPNEELPWAATAGVHVGRDRQRRARQHVGQHGGEQADVRRQLLDIADGPRARRPLLGDATVEVREHGGLRQLELGKLDRLNLALLLCVRLQHSGRRARRVHLGE